MTGFPASIWLVGAGNMGGAMLRAWLGAGMDPASVTVIDPFARDLPEGVTARDDEPAGAPEVIVLAVKPQMVGTVLPSSRRKPGSQEVAVPRASRDPGFRRDDEKRPVLISILAGVEEAVLFEQFEVSTVIRAMPNLPVSLGKGVVALHGGAGDTAARDMAEALMAPLGLVEWIGEERLFHAVTALSGSGPGFVYRFLETLAKAGAELGLPPDQALRFANATVEGAAALAIASGEPPAVLAERVASPGGTTRAGLNVLDKDHALQDLVEETLSAAAGRSAELAEAARK